MEAGWEQAKENAQPLRRGRDPSRLGLSSAPSAASLAAQRAEFEAALAHARDESPEDPLRPWVRYLRWTQEAFPSGSSELLTLYERCLREFKDDEQYRNDATYLKVWIGYAALLDNPSSVFKYMRENGIGELLADYYIATAWTAERREDFALADKAYTVGISKKAQPLEQLQLRQSQFQRRMSRRWLKEAERRRQGEDLQEEEVEGRRKLQTLSEGSAATMRRLAEGQQQQQQQQQRQGQGMPGQRKVEGFNVFVEQQPSQGKVDDWGDGGGARGTGWKQLESQREMRKENELEPAPWGHQALGSRQVQQAEVAMPQERAKAFDVFVDDSSAPAPAPAGTGGGLTERSRKAKTDAEVLMKKPLKHFDNPDARPTTIEPRVEHEEQQRQRREEEEAASPETPAQRKLGRDVEDDVTINTRMALDDVFEMFGSPSMKGREARPMNDGHHVDDKASPASPAAARNTSASTSTYGGGGGGEEPALRSAAKPFSVFGAELEAPRSTTKKPFSIFAADSEATHESTSSKPFSVFSGGSSGSGSSGSDKPSKPFSVFAEPRDENLDASNRDRSGSGGGGGGGSKPFSVFSSGSSGSGADAAPGTRSGKTPFSVLAEKTPGKPLAPTHALDMDGAADDAFNFAPLESILEASAEVDESMSSGNLSSSSLRRRT